MYNRDITYIVRYPLGGRVRRRCRVISVPGLITRGQALTVLAVGADGAALGFFPSSLFFSLFFLPLFLGDSSIYTEILL